MASQRSKRPAAGFLAAGLLGLSISLVPTSAGADPVAIGNPSEALQRLADLARQSEQASEAVHNAQMQLDAKAAEQQRAETEQAKNRADLDAAKARIAEFQSTIDRAAADTYRGARPNPLVAVLMSDSPQQVLDQMSAIDVIATEHAAEQAKYKQAASAAAAAEDASRKSTDIARSAADRARADRDALASKQSALNAEIDQVTQAWTALSTAEKTTFAGSPFPPGLDVNSLLKGLAPGAGAGALQAGLTRVGMPYVWGATGPSSFDCSGLVVWAFKQIGKTLPRSSQAQAQAGTPVDRKDLQPGDVVTFYSDASHVGIYAGNGNVLHASTYGVPVAVAPMSGMPFHNARRY